MLFEHIISLIAPHCCLQCGKESAPLCGPCLALLQPAQERCYICQQISPAGSTCARCAPLTAVQSVRPAVAYKGVAKDLLWMLKADRARSAARIMGAQCSTLLSPADSLLITYVPTAPVRVRQRGYDQAKLIARSVAQYSGLPMIPLLARISSDRQVGADRQTRHQQLVGAFRPVNQYAMNNKSIILIDDVITTGSSIRAAGEVLTRAGAQSISAVTFAQA